MADVKGLFTGAPCPITAGGSLTFTNFTINSGGGTIDRVAWAIQLPVADTWTHIGFRYGARSGTPVQHTIGLQSLGTTGLPDGTYLGGGTPASATFTPPADATWDGTWQWVALANSYLSTRGQIVVPVIEPVGTPDGSNNSSFTQGISNFWAVRHGTPYNLTQTDGAAFAKVAARVPVIALKSASRYVGFPIESLYSTLIATNAHRQAVKFTLPAGSGDTFKVYGLRLIGQVPATGNNWKVGIWNAAGTELMGISLDCDFSATLNTANTTFEVYFDDTPATLTFGTTYYAGIERVDAGTGLNGLGVDTSAELAALPGGSDWHLATWNGSVWADDQTVRPLIELILDDVTEPSSAGVSGARIFGGF